MMEAIKIGTTKKALVRSGSIPRGAICTVTDIMEEEQRICIDVGGYALTIEEFIKIFEPGLKSTERGLVYVAECFDAKEDALAAGYEYAFSSERNGKMYSKITTDANHRQFAVITEEDNPFWNIGNPHRG